VARSAAASNRGPGKCFRTTFFCCVLVGGLAAVLFGGLFGGVFGFEDDPGFLAGADFFVVGPVVFAPPFFGALLVGGVFFAAFLGAGFPAAALLVGFLVVTFLLALAFVDGPGFLVADFLRVATGTPQ